MLWTTMYTGGLNIATAPGTVRKGGGGEQVIEAAEAAQGTQRRQERVGEEFCQRRKGGGQVI